MAGPSLIARVAYTPRRYGPREKARVRAAILGTPAGCRVTGQWRFSGHYRRSPRRVRRLYHLIHLHPRRTPGRLRLGSGLAALQRQRLARSCNRRIIGCPTASMTVSSPSPAWRPRSSRGSSARSSAIWRRWRLLLPLGVALQAVISGSLTVIGLAPRLPGDQALPASRWRLLIALITLMCVGAFRPGRRTLHDRLSVSFGRSSCSPAPMRSRWGRSPRPPARRAAARAPGTRCCG